MQDYPIEQYVRDAKIDTLYEGTTAIQGARPLLPQDRARPGPRAVAPGDQIQEFVKGDPGDGALAGERELLGTALDDVQAIIGTMVGHLTASDPRPGATPFVTWSGRTRPGC